MKRNIANTLPCEMCGERIEKTINNKTYCPDCAKEIKKQQSRIADKKYKDKLKAQKEARKRINPETLLPQGI